MHRRWLKAITILVVVAAAVALLGILFPIVILLAIALVALAFWKPRWIARLARLRGPRRLPAWLTRSPVVFALVAALSLVLVSSAAGIVVYARWSPLARLIHDRMESPAPVGAGGLTPARVTGVVDGDTLKVTFDGRGQTVRIIGVDTPETKDPRQPVMCYGAEATAFARQLVDQAGGRVLLEKDVSETDQYGRLLRYVWLELPGGRRMLNEELVTQGYAQVSTYPPDVRYQQIFIAEERAARQADLGLWGACGSFGVPVTPTSSATRTTTPRPSPGGAIDHAGVPPLSAFECPPDYPIKGNADSGIYHQPGDPAYLRTKPEICFATPADAHAAGFRGAGGS